MASESILLVNSIAIARRPEVVRRVDDAGVNGIWNDFPVTETVTSLPSGSNSMNEAKANLMEQPHFSSRLVL
jgi:hypothetical protein